MSEIERLSRLDTCAVSDALDRLGLPGAVSGIRSHGGPHKIAGRAVTVKLVAADGRASSQHLATAAIEASGPGDVIVIEHRSRDDCAGWGGLLSRAARARGVEGTLVDGAVRDVDESREIGYPVFARAAVPATARGRIVEEGWNVPVLVVGVRVDPGDFVIADGTGVAFVPKARVEEVLRAAEEIAERERGMAEAVERGTPVSRVMGGDYESMLGGGNDGESR
jgi:4-hydroxy-4-methyl-2-oxoglutarate aldolase